MTLDSAYLKKGKKAPGRKASCADPGSRRRRIWKKSRQAVKTIPRNPESPISVHKRGQILIHGLPRPCDGEWEGEGYFSPAL